MAKGTPRSENDVALALRIFLDTGGNCAEAARAIGTSNTVVSRWAKAAGWQAILDRNRADVEASIAAESIRQQVTIRELRVNLEYRSLLFIHEKVQAWEATPLDKRGDFPFDPLKLAEAMSKAGQPSGAGKPDGALTVKTNVPTATTREPRADSTTS